jgi:8-oxo-dGTP pyrophosphatase MutT (NUDIX family)
MYLEDITFTDDNGNSMVWESVMRVHKGGAVVVIAALQQSGQFLLVRQFRPPAGGYVIEFPAGLVDDGETPETAAV